MTIARVTVREAANRRVLLVGLVISVALLALFGVGFNAAIDQTANPSDPTDPAVAASILTVLGLYAFQLLAAFIAVLLASGAVAPEVESGRLHAILARPITRTSWLAQRAGTLTVLAGGYLAAMAAAVLAIAWAIGGYQPIALWRGLALLAMEMVVLVAVGTALSVRLSAIATGVALVALYGAAWIGGIMEFIGSAVDNTTLETIGLSVSLVMPTDALWRGASYFLQSPAFLVASRLDADTGNPFAGQAEPSIAFLVWTLAYTAGWWAIARHWFNQRDL